MLARTAEVLAKSGAALVRTSIPDGAASCACKTQTLPSPKIAPINNRFIFFFPSEGRPQAWNKPTPTVIKWAVVCLRSFAHVEHKQKGAGGCLLEQYSANTQPGTSVRAGDSRPFC